MSGRATELALHGARVVVGARLNGDGATIVRDAAAGRRIAVVTDTNVAGLHARPLAAALGVPPDDCLVVPAGEASKSRDEWARLTDAMLTRGFGRDSCVVAVGGGVVGDLAGFVAATYLRGVPVVQVPTSLLAMIDAAIGGKTGVDTPHGKNLVGAFHHPAAVVIDPGTLDTLPAAQRRNGLAEAAKHALLGDAGDVARFAADAAPLLDPAHVDRDAATALILRNVRRKADIVARDATEAGVRKVLNLGHTIGHAIEQLSGYRLMHGECVAIGLVVEARIAARLGVAAASLERTVADLVRAVALPTAVPQGFDAAAIVAATRTDKKARGGVVEYALLAEVGTPAGAARGYGTPVPDDVALAALAALAG